MSPNGPLQVGAVVHAGGPPGLTVFNVTVTAQRTPAALVWLVRTHVVDVHFLDFAASLCVYRIAPQPSESAC